MAESEVADLLRDTERAWAERGEVAIGSYPIFRKGRVGANFVVRSPDAALAERCAEALCGALEAAGHTVVDDAI